LSDRVRSGTDSAFVRPNGERSTPSTESGGPQPALPSYSVGQRVFHTKFGEGSIVEIVTKSDDQELAVEFVRHGPKRLMATLARLDIVD
jgi:DNA helicase-2/ATP-dependent DNA helicase PcrA